MVGQLVDDPQLVDAPHILWIGTPLLQVVFLLLLMVATLLHLVRQWMLNLPPLVPVLMLISLCPRRFWSGRWVWKLFRI